MFAFLKVLNPKWILALIMVAVVTAFMWVAYDFVIEAMDNQQLVIQQELTLQLKEAEIQTLNDAIDQAERAQQLADLARQEAEQRASELRQVRDAAQNSGEENDGEIAPVLGDTLRALRDRM